MRVLLLAILLVLPARAQFTLQHSGTTASLRGIAVADSDGQVAWASGAGGTVLRTVDGGSRWQPCAVPPAAQALDFRGVVAFDASTALVMASGKGDSSRLYRTADGCRTWQLVLSNPDAPAGFFDAVVFRSRTEGWLLGDPVQGRFVLSYTEDGGQTWRRSRADGVPPTEVGAFAASNQSLLLLDAGPVIGGGGAMLFRGVWPQCSQSLAYNDPGQCLDRIPVVARQLPLASGNGSSGIFALAQHADVTVAVGGDYAAPAGSADTAAWSTDGGLTWTGSTSQPHGYRSSVTFEPRSRTWLTVGPNGTDVSRDDGRTWQPLRPDAPAGDAPDADRSWNALALPFVVGPRGRIGRLRHGAVTGESKTPAGSR